MAIATTSSQGNDDIDLRALLGLLIDRKWTILAGAAAFFVVSVLYVMVATPEYEARAVVQVEKRTPEVPGSSNTPATAMEAADAQAVTEVQLLTSRSVVGQAVDALGLATAVEPARFPLIGDLIARRYQAETPGEVASPWFGMTGDGWGGEKLEITRLDVADALFGSPLQLVANGGGRYTLSDGEGNILLQGSAGQVASGHGVTLLVKTLWANAGMRFDVRRRNPLPIIDALRNSLSAVEQGRDSGIIALTYRNEDPVLARQVLEQITAAYVRENVERNSAEAATSMRFVKQQLPKASSELEKAQAALNDFQNRTQAVDIQQQTRALLDQTTSLDGNIQQLRMQQADIARRFTPQHPAYKTLMQQIGQLQVEKGAIQQRISTLPDTQRGLLRLTREVEVRNQNYSNLLDQAQRLDLVRASAIGNARVIDRPMVNADTPVWPKPLLVIAIGTVLGGVLMTMLVLLRQVMKRGVVDASEIELLGMPVFASIPLSKHAHRLVSPRHLRQSRPQLLALDAPSDMATEALRGLRTSLQFTRLQSQNNLLMIASPSAGVGKSFVCSNLAVTVAQAGQRVLLIDADMRRGKLHEVIGTAAENGLSELIAGMVPIESALRKVAGTDNLGFIARGKLPPNPSELLMQPKFSALLRELAARYDLVIIDTPPVLAVTDAAVIGHHAGTSLMVLRYGMHQPNEIVQARQRLEQSGVEVKGAIFNVVEKRGASPYAHGYEYASSP